MNTKMVMKKEGEGKRNEPKLANNLVPFGKEKKRKKRKRKTEKKILST